MSVILGIDPGSRCTGWGVVATHNSNLVARGFGVIELPEQEPLALRLGILTVQLAEIISEYKPTAMAVEKVFLGKNADSAFKLGHARGVALAQAGQSNVPVAEYATRHVKKMLTGSGAASKEQVQFMVERMLGVRAPRLDATDALALAICHARELEISAAFAAQDAGRGDLNV